MICTDNKILERVIKKHDIPINMVEVVDDIFWFGGSSITEDVFDKIIEYLKKRALNDCSNRKPDDPRFLKEGLYDWTFYLREYGYYIKEILHGGVIDSDRDKYLFPKDVYDITYKYRNKRKELFLKYMKYNHPESMKQIK